ncbi:pyrroline-5-carboxylate reductase [Hysterangium stoloniferum]|nr:pyrroline-5-carboxylate reductase [Hysterangium stoloniferum]
MGYTLCVIASLESNGPHFDRPKWETHTPESIKAFQTSLRSLGPLGATVEVTAKQNTAYVSCKTQLRDLEDKLLISILAGVTISQLKTLVNPSTNVYRRNAMPKTPCKIRAGMTVVSTTPASQDTHCDLLEEKHFDACTAFSGSDPTFACIFLEAMADGALELAAQTHPAQIKDAVTNAHALKICEDGRVRSTIVRPIQVATEHASQLGQVSEQMIKRRVEINERRPECEGAM